MFSQAMTIKVSPHFTLEEAIKSSLALRLGINNAPPEDLLERISNTATHILEPARNHFDVPFSPSSWFRCLELEAELCKKTIERQILSGQVKDAAEYLAKKQHPKGFAVDFEIPGVPNLKLARWIFDNLQYDQLIIEFYDKNAPKAGWIHCSFSLQSENRQETFTFDGRHYSKGLPI